MKTNQPMRGPSRRRVLGTLGAFAVPALVAGRAMADAYPVRPVTLVVPFPAGGASDQLARQLGEALGKVWNRSVIVDNRPGASQIIGASVVAKAKPDGYTLMLSDDGVFTLNPALYKRMTYSPKELDPIIDLVEVQNVLCMAKDVPANNFKEMISYAKANPGKLNFASLGSGSIMHLLLESLTRAAGVQIAHIPYRGYPPALQDVVANQAQLVAGALTQQVLGFYKAGSLRPLAVSGSARSPSLPDVPTFTELGFPQVQARVVFMLSGPIGMPPEIVAQIREQTSKLLKTPSFVSTALTPNALTPLGNSPQEVAKELDTWSAYYRRIVKEAGIALD